MGESRNANKIFKWAGNQEAVTFLISITNIHAPYVPISAGDKKVLTNLTTLRAEQPWRREARNRDPQNRRPSN